MLNLFIVIYNKYEIVTLLAQQPVRLFVSIAFWRQIGRARGSLLDSFVYRFRL